MDYSALPPEINSGRMYSGPGSGPLLSAAAAWDGISAELQSTAAAYASAISTLTGQQWQGPASAAMATAAAPYVEWLTSTAAQAQQTAVQARAAASAYAAAFAMTIPPPVVATNRSLLMALVATNILGQNTPAIAATEAQYAEMWAQDAAAMENYAGSSAVASQLTSFTSPPQTTNPAQPQPPKPNPGLSLRVLQDLGILDAAQGATAVGTIGNFGVQGANYGLNVSRIVPTAVPAVPKLVSEQESGLGGAGVGTSVVPAVSGPAAGRPAALVSATTGRASSVGALAVPQAWSTPVEVRQLARALPMTSIAGPLAAQAAAESPYAGLGLASMAGGGMGGLAGLGASSANTAAATPATVNAAPARAVKPAARRPAATAAAGAVTLPAENTAASLAEVLAAMPGATVVVIPPPPVAG